jgi:hypothetical protein
MEQVVATSVRHVDAGLRPGRAWEDASPLQHGQARGTLGRRDLLPVPPRRYVRRVLQFRLADSAHRLQR